ncbi:regulatory subunit of cyclin-dependent kinase [Halteromyces radiatus]|uniref:regulatory subunit of cyclin-dependent kinase n=1 Tax=Halteromyces radiatus TaxID=101107 RepID=UPI00221EE63E|nr:regulatory subunit of cyclin-dependent kinase [Halteromyces radiatus]KAI8089545.1 regulatory subunit of cyclin-dependent kinase [Halteromyces radiatus]
MKRSAYERQLAEDKAILSRPDPDAKLRLQRADSKRSSKQQQQQQQQQQQKTSEENNAELEKLREQMRRDVQNYKKEIITSGIYNDTYEYRHIILPKQIARYLPDKKYKILLQEKEYRRLGVNISSGWQHYMTHQPEPNILLLRRSFEDAKRLAEERKEYLRQKELQNKKAAEVEASGSAEKVKDQSLTTETSSDIKNTRRKITNTSTTMSGQEAPEQGDSQSK